MKKSTRRIFTLPVMLILTLMVLSGCHSVESDVQGPLNNLNNFTAYTRKNEPFTQEEFADYDLTIICFWAPWSDASIYELKQLVSLSERFPENIAFVSVCLDSELSDSKLRLRELDLKGFTTLQEGDGDFKVMSDAIVNVPTTVIVDNAGNLMGDPIIGIQEKPEKTYLKYLNQAIKKTGGQKIKLSMPTGANDESAETSTEIDTEINTEKNTLKENDGTETITDEEDEDDRADE